MWSIIENENRQLLIYSGQICSPMASRKMCHYGSLININPSDEDESAKLKNAQEPCSTDEFNE